MRLSEYQQKTREFAVYPENKAIEYLALGLSSEAGEVTGKVKKILRGDRELDTSAKNDLIAEIGDCYWYLARLCDTLGVDSEQVLQGNIDKLTERKNKGMIKGDGDGREKITQVVSVDHHGRASINSDYLASINRNDRNIDLGYTLGK